MARKQTKRKAFNFLRSYFDVLNEIENESDKLNFLLSVINKQFLDEDPEGLSFIANLCYQSQRHPIETSIKGYKDKTKTDLQGNKLTPKEDPLQGGVKGGGVDPSQQEQEQEEEQEEEKPKPKIPKEFSEAVRDCFVNCLDFFPDHYKPKNKKITDQWMDTIHKLNTIEQIPFESIEAITKWAREGWWSKNFQSLLKLRKKNSDGIMYLSIFNDGMSAKPVSNGKSTAESRAEINRRIIEDLKNV